LRRQGGDHRVHTRAGLRGNAEGRAGERDRAGAIVTDLTASMAPEDRQAFIDALPVHRFGRPEEIAATALLLAGPEGGFYVGATLSPNGGDVMY
jgi:NAD(P)-dependent dehydrogenase (short-subunit alcohol dehydrogenase family)